MKNLNKALALLLAMLLVLTCVPAVAEETAAIDEAYLMYADAAWANQYWGGDAPEGVTAINAAITGEGDYTVGLEFAAPAEGLAFSAVGIVNGEKTLPNWYIRINAIRVNGEEIAVAKGYTSSDDGVTTRMNIFNEWVGEVPADARSFDGNTADAAAIIVDKEAFASVTKVEVDFTLMKNAVDVAYIMFADSAWAAQWWHDGSENPVVANEATVTGYGDYTVGLDFTATEAGFANGVAFTALGMVNGEKTYPGAYLKINEIRLNGEAVEFAKGYTSSDDGVCTRMNIMNEWVGAVPEDARSFDGTTEDATWIMIAKEAFPAELKTMEVDFSLMPVVDTAYLMYADAAWANQYWGGDAPEGVTATVAEVDGPGVYTVGLEFATPAEGLAFSAVGIVTGEKTFPGYFINVTDVKVNGESIEVGKGYTSSDDQVCTRENLYNEWVSDLPSDAHRADGDLEGASPIVVDKEAFASVTSVEVTFEYIYGEAPETAKVTLTADEAAELLAKDYNAYIGVQSATYIFRNQWNDNYGRDDAEHEGFFNRLTGWDADNNAVDYGGTFEDALITGDGTYTVSLTTGDMGFGTDESFNLLFVSTEIPSALVKEGYVTISDVQVKIGDARTQEYTEITTGDEYARITLIDTYNQAETPFGYTVPGANTAITVTFTVTGLTD